MSTIVRQSELVRRAFAHLCGLLRDNPEKKAAALIDETAMRFNLSPLDSDALCRMFSEEAGGRRAGPTEETGGR
ncbi:MAG: hypothetical protein LBS65_10945 [Desulfovibrio sp.]|jgi:hypothetical protein|nr:hypothetical protein [Desulfovibrio sp.]